MKTFNCLTFNGFNWNGVVQKRVGVTDYTYRFYDPVTGRWPSRDPIGENVGANLYSTGNDLLAYTDFLGLSARVTDKLGEEGAREASEETAKTEGIEFCGSICCKKGEYFRTKAKQGRKGRCDSTIVSPCPEGTKEVGIFHSHPTNSDFSYDDYTAAPSGGSNYLGRPDGIRRLGKSAGIPKPTTSKKGNDGKYYPYPPENNGLRAEQGLAPLNNGSTDPYKNSR